jgi:hypothetical protein
MSFKNRGFLVQPEDTSWQWGLKLAGYGSAREIRSLSGQAHLNAKGSRVTYDWDDCVQEWFMNDPRGLEHGLNILRPPFADAPDSILRCEFEVCGTLRPFVDRDGGGVRFVDSARRVTVNYSELDVRDADGKKLPAHFESPMCSAGPRIALAVDTGQARYPLTVDPLAQEAYLKGDNTQAGDGFGYSVAASRDTLVVGAFGQDHQDFRFKDGVGAAYVFVRSGGAWMQEAYLKPSNDDPTAFFGANVAVSGDTIVVRAPLESGIGAVYVFVRNGGVWIQQAKLTTPRNYSGAAFAGSVAISGDTIVIGDPADASGATGVNGDQSDSSSPQSGAAFVYVRTGETWTLQAYLKASNTAQAASFGGSVSVSGDTVVVGADNEDSDATGVNGDQTNHRAPGSGAAYVFVRSGGIWSQQAYLKSSNTKANATFGFSVSISGNTVAIDSSSEGYDPNMTTPVGAVYVFVRQGESWTQQAYLKGFNTSGTTGLPGPVTVSSDRIVAGAIGEGGAGVAYVFVRSGSVWVQDARLTASNPDQGDQFGGAVGLSGDTVVVGAYFESSSATGINGNQFDNSARWSGAAYVYGFTSVNQPPLAPDQTFTRTVNLSLKISVPDLLAVCSDPDFGIPALQSVGPSVGGAKISTTTSYIFYLPSGNEDDSFPYTINDGHGGTATGTIHISTVNPGGKVIAIKASNYPLGLLEVAGIPGYTYEIQRATDPAGPFVTVEIQQTPPGGTFTFVDPNPPPQVAFYLLMLHLTP